MPQTVVLQPDPQSEKRMENIERMLGWLVERERARGVTKESEDNAYYTGPEFLRMFRCGRDKLKELVLAGSVERNDDFGKHPRYRWLGDKRKGELVS